MFRFIPLLGGRAAAGAVAAVALTLAACADSPAAPVGTAARETGGPNPALIGNGGQISAYATVKIVDIHWHYLKDPATVTFKSYPSGATVEIKDNAAGDYSSHPGVITAAVKPGATYEACFKDARFYMNDNRDPVTYPQCAKVTTSSMTPNIGTIFGRRYPKFTFLSKDIYGNMVVPGGTLQISMFGWTGIIADRDLGFGGSLDGTIVFETTLPPTATTWCEYSPPLKYQLVSVKCGSIMTEFDKNYTITWVHQKLLY